MHGFERESIRLDAAGGMSFSPHPERLGFSLTQGYVTTDFCEPQLELITPPHSSLDDCLRWLEQLHAYVLAGVGDERIWPLSMPPKLPDRADDIVLAQFGNSAVGMEKTQYRRGLGHRYGKRRLTISGTHYSFSFDDSPWFDEWLSRHGADDLSEPYMHLIRNVYRRLPFLTYLFGDSPAFDESFGVEKDSRLKRLGRSTLYASFSTSLRMTDIGYTSRVQDELQIGYSSLGEYVDGLEKAVGTSYAPYEEFSGEQLNANYLQIENELYRPVRIQQDKEMGESLVEALRRRGAGRIEFRGMDIDHEQPSGVDEHSAAFMNLVFHECMAAPSPPFSAEEWTELHAATQRVAWEGRDARLTLPGRFGGARFHDSGLEYCDGVVSLAEELDSRDGSESHRRALERQMEKWRDPQETASGKQLATLLDAKMDFVELGWELAEKHRAYLLDMELDEEIQSALQAETRQSIATYETTGRKSNLRQE